MKAQMDDLSSSTETLQRQHHNVSCFLIKKYFYISKYIYISLGVDSSNCPSGKCVDSKSTQWDHSGGQRCWKGGGWFGDDSRSRTKHHKRGNRDGRKPHKGDGFERVKCNKGNGGGSSRDDSSVWKSNYKRKINIKKIYKNLFSYLFLLYFVIDHKSSHALHQRRNGGAQINGSKSDDIASKSDGEDGSGAAILGSQPNVGTSGSDGKDGGIYQRPS